VTPGTLDITIHQKSTFSANVDVSFSLVGHSVYAQIWDRRLLTKIADVTVTVTDASAGTFTLYLSHTVTSGMTKSSLRNAVWDCMVVYSSGIREYILEGNVLFDPGYTEP
jgi:hypothetical protein